MYSKVITAVNWGIEGQCVEIETNVIRGLPNHIIVGLPSTIVVESKERVKTAIKTTCMKFPDDRIVQNLFPANLRKEGSQLDLPIAIGIMSSVLEIPQTYTESFAFLGELSLDGKLKGVQGILSLMDGIKKRGIKKIVIPKENIPEARYISDIEIYPYEELQTLIEDAKMQDIKQRIFNVVEPEIQTFESLDYDEVIGQSAALRAVEIAVTGFHNLLIIGPPGCGKSMIAQRLITIMPELKLSEKIELTKIYGISVGNSNLGLVHQRPFRSPHHTISRVGLVGGGSALYPGEISKAHKGILYLDEIAEFKSDAIEALREPLSTQTVNLTKGGKALIYPADFMLVATMNPCPCGNYLSKDESCICSHHDIKRYFGKLSGPILDRLDMTLFMERVHHIEETSVMREKAIASLHLKQRIERAIEFKKEREQIDLDPVSTGNITASARSLRAHVGLSLTKEAEDLLIKYHDKGKLTMRSYQKLVQLARTIADLDLSLQIEKHHILEAFSYQTSTQIKRFLS